MGATERGFIKVVGKMDRQERARFLLKFAKLFALTHERYRDEHYGRWKSTRRPCRVYTDPRPRRFKDK